MSAFPVTYSPRFTAYLTNILNIKKKSVQFVSEFRSCLLCKLPADGTVSTCSCCSMCTYASPLSGNVSICLLVVLHMCLYACVYFWACVCAVNLPALKHQQQITDGPPALEVFYFPEETRYVKNKHVQH